MTVEKIPLKRKPSDVFKLEELIELFDLRDVNDVWESWSEWEENSALGYACYDLGYDFNFDSWQILKDCPNCGGYEIGGSLRPEEGSCNLCNDSGKIEVDHMDLWDTPEYEEGQRFWGGKLYKCWEDAVTNTLEKYFDWHNLDLVEVALTWRSNGQTYESPGFRVVPQKSWQDAAQCLAETDSGWGYAYNDTAKDFKNYNSARTYRQAVLENLSVMSAYGSVYGEKSMQSMQEDNFDQYTRYRL